MPQVPPLDAVEGPLCAFVDKPSCREDDRVKLLSSKSQRSRKFQTVDLLSPRHVQHFICSFAPLLLKLASYILLVLRDDEFAGR